MNFAEEAVSRAREDKDYATMYLAMAVGELQKQLTSPPQQSTIVRQPLTDEEMRTEFEAWVIDTCGTGHMQKFSDGTYLRGFVHDYWKCWKAAHGIGKGEA